MRAPYRREVVLLAVTVLGIAAFTLLFQGRARYLLAFVPVVVALAGMVHRLRLPRLRRHGSPAADHPVHARTYGEGVSVMAQGVQGSTSGSTCPPGSPGDMLLGALVDAGALARPSRRPPSTP